MTKNPRLYSIIVYTIVNMTKNPRLYSILKYYIHLHYNG